MKNIPAISIIVPVFNAEKYIATCIDSILNQTFEDFELIIVDDESSDRSAKIIQTYTDPRIRFYRRVKNFGRSSTRNFGLELSSGKYIYFMDHDDAILPQTLEILFNSAEKSQADAVYMNSFLETNCEDFSMTSEFQVNQNFCANPNPRDISINLIDRLNAEYIHGGTMVNTWIRICRRDFLIDNEILFPLISRNEDGLIHLAILCFAKKIRVIDACCYIHRSSFSNAMSQSADKHIKLTLESLVESVKYMEQILNRTNLSLENRVQLESFSLKEMIRWLIVQRAYSGELDFETIDRILSENLDLDSSTYRMIFHAFALILKWIYRVPLDSRPSFELK